MKMMVVIGAGVLCVALNGSIALAQLNSTTDTNRNTLLPSYGGSTARSLASCTPSDPKYVCNDLRGNVQGGLCDATTLTCACSTTGASYDKIVQCTN